MPEPTTPELRRLPGRARPQKEALREYEEEVQKRRRNLPIDKRVLGDLLYPNAEKLYRWRIQLDCECVIETLTYGAENLPTDNQWTNGAGFRLPAGQVICPDHIRDGQAPYREIVEWGTQKIHDFPADPVEPQDDWDPETWKKIRRPEPHQAAFWSVTYSCGHQDNVCVGDVNWKPGDEPRRLSAKRLAEIRTEIEEYRAANPDSPYETKEDREHEDRYVERGCPRPDPEDRCHSCLSARQIVAYQKVGWLVAPPKPTTPPTPEEVAAQARKKAAARERKIAKLKAELAALEAEDDG